MVEVKIDEELHERIIKFIKEGENRFDFPTAKSFVDKAVLKMLKDLKKIKSGK
jgi:hypothetical protein